MLTAEIKQIINNARDILVGRVPDPKSQVDLITTAMIYKFMDDMDIAGQRRVFFVGDMEKYAFSKIMDVKQGAQQRLNLYAEALENLPFATSIPELFRKIFKDAFLPFRDPNTLTLFLREISKFNYDNSENLGNAFEYLLSVMGSQGDAGMFRTPRHIIDFMVNVVQPTKDDTILDPACGTAGFLISAYLYVLKHNPELQAKDIRKLTENIIGYDISPDMVKLATVNMYLHRFNQPKIYEYDSLSDDSKWGDSFDCILANPPFMTPKGGIIPHNKFQVKANKAEVLFVDYIAEHLNMNGRAGIVVPEGIMFQTANAYKQLRKMLVDDNYLYAVVSLPNGVFNPYAGVKTSILFFDRKLAKEKKDILFIRVDNDGFDLGAKRNPIQENDLPRALEIIEKWKERQDISGCEQATAIPKSKIRKNDYNLLGSRYKEQVNLNNVKYPVVSLAKLESKKHIEFLRGAGLSKKDIDTAGEYPCILYGDLYTIYSNPIIKAVVHKTNIKNKVTSEVGDVLVPATTTADAMGIAIARALNISGIELGGDINIIRTKNKYIHSSFLAYLLCTVLKPKLASFAKGANILHLSNSDIKQIEIPLPPLEIQKQIVAEIENKQQAIDNAREIIRNLERERSYFASLLEGIDYETTNLGTIAEIISGQSPEGRFYNQVGEGVPFYQGRTEFGDVFIKEPKTWTTKSTKLAIKNDILMSVRAPVGPVNMLGFDRVCIGRGLAAIRVDTTKAIIPYVYGYLKSIEDTITGNGGAIFDSINRTQIAELEIPLPSLADQQKIVDVFNKEQQAIDGAKALIEHLESRITDVINRVFISATKDS